MYLDRSSLVALSAKQHFQVAFVALRAGPGTSAIGGGQTQAQLLTLILASACARVALCFGLTVRSTLR